MLDIIKDALMTPPIEGVTINTVLFMTPSFRSFLFGLIIIIFSSSAAFFIIKRFGIKRAVRKALLIAFFSVGLVYAVQADIGWSKWLISDLNNYGRSTGEKTLAMEGPLYEFSANVKNVLSDSNYELYSSLSVPSLRMEYFLLPSRKKEAAEFIVILVDRDAVFDPYAGILRRGEQVIENLEPVYQYTHDAYVLRKR